MKKVKQALLCVLFLLCGMVAEASVSVPSAELAAYAEPVIVLETETDMTLGAALEATGKMLGTSGTIVKTGKGTLTVDGSAIAAFDGEIHIWEGAWKVSAAGHLGTATGATYVHGTSNAEPAEKEENPTERPPQLWFDTDPTNPVTFPGEVLHLAGSGFCHLATFSTGAGWGWGAIYAKASRAEWPSGSESRWGSTWILDADATVMVSGAKPSAAGIDLEMNGHELFLFPSTHYTALHAQKVFGFQQREQVTEAVWFKSVATGGASAMIHTGYGLEAEYKQAGGDSSNVLMLDWSSLYTRNMQSDLDWTLSVTNEALFQIISYASAANKGVKNGGEHRTLAAPVQLKGRLYGNSYTAQASLTITGQVSGEGSLCLGESAQPFYCYLDNPNNTFAGGVTVMGGTELIVGADGSLPADGGALVLTNSSVRFENDGVSYHLPGLVLGGASRVENVAVDFASSWGTVRKIADGTSVWQSAAGAQALAVEQGTLDVKSCYEIGKYYGLACYFSSNVTAGTSFGDFRARAVESDRNATTTRDWLAFNIGSQARVPDGGAVGYEGWIYWDGADGAEWTFVAASGPAMIYCECNGEVLFNCNNKTMNNRVLNTFADLDSAKVTVRHGWNHFAAYTLKAWGGMASATTGAFSWPGGKALCVNFNGGESVNPDDYVFITDPGDGSDLRMETGDASEDGHFWLPNLGAVNVFPNATLTLAGDAALDAIGGSGAVSGNVKTGRVLVDGTVITSAGALALDGNLTLTDGATIEITGANQIRRAKDLPVLTVTGTLSAPDDLAVTWDGNRGFTARISDDGKSILVSAKLPGLVLMVR